MKSLVEKDQSVINKSDQLIRYYSVPVISSKEKALNTLLSRIENNSVRHIRPFYFRKSVLIPAISAAASIALIITFYVLTSVQTVVNSNQAVLAQRLPDNSRVILEKGSKIRYLATLNARKVKLNGSAYFEVQKGKKFKLSSESGEIEVLGTRFSVTEHNGELTVQCFEGKVKTEYSNTEYIVPAGSRFEGSHGVGKTFEIDEIVDYPEVARLNRNYENASLTDVVSDLESFFNVKIEIEPGVTGKFGGNITSGDIENAVDILCTSLNLKYRFNSENKISIRN